MKRKKITFETNYNQKLDCPRFIHVDLAPPRLIPEAELNSTVVEIHTKDGSHQPVLAKVVDLCRLTLDNMNTAFTWCSHEMSSDEYRLWITTKISDIKRDTQMAVFFYQKISAQA
ncbi:MAG: hypothetical protein ACTHMV_13655 [Chitinophagaceae bacterium]